jgi:hypothetical protein
MIIQWQYIDETTWNDYDDLVGVVDPRTSFIVRVIDDVGDSDLGDSDLNVVNTRLVQVCGDQYSAYIGFDVIDTETERKYLPVMNGIPDSEIDTIEWRVREYLDESDLGDSDYDIIDFGGVQRDATGVYSVCVSAVVTFVCNCDPLVVEQACYTFTEDKKVCPDDLGLEMELEDGAWKPVRVGTIECCVALDIILWKIKETDDWSILREPIETIYANTVWFKRVVAFNDNICPIFSIEINSDES